MALPFDSLQHPLILAHRGSVVLGPENTLHTYELALAAGADVLEIDVHASADGVAMVIHDPTVDRTSNGSGAVAGLALSALKRLDFAWNFTLEDGSHPLRGRGITIPTLEEVFDRFPDRCYSIDMKADDSRLAAEVAKLVNERGMRERVVLSSFHPSIAALLREVVPPLHVGADLPQGLRLLASSLLHLPLRGPLASAYMLPVRIATLPLPVRRFIAALHGGGRRGYFWTIDAEETVRSLLLAGADGIITNRPALVFEIRRELFTAFQHAQR